MRHLPLTVLLLALTLPLAILPMGLAIRAGEAIGWLAFMVWGSRRRIAIANLEAAIRRGAIRTDKPAADVIRQNFRNMGRSLAELVKVYYGLGDGLIGPINVEGLEHYQAALARGKGVIFVGGHCGNWELMVLCIAKKIGRFHGVARRQSNPFVNQFIVKSREKYGSGVIYKEGALRKFLSILKKGESVGVLIDQSVIPEEGVLVNFLGAPAWTAKMPALLAKKTGAAVLAGFIYRIPEGYVIRIQPEPELTGDETADTQRLSDYVEEFVRDNPADWLWIHRRWKRT